MAELHKTPLGPSWEKIREIVLATNATSITLDGLNLDADKAYMILLSLKGSGAGDVTVSMQINGDTTVTNYYTQGMGADDALLSSARTNSPSLDAIYSNFAIIAEIMMIHPVGDYPMWIVHWLRGRGVNTILGEHRGSYTSNVNVTSIQIIGNVVNGLAVGSKVILFKVSG